MPLQTSKQNALTLRVLHLEDNLHDRELIARALRRGGLECEFIYTVTESDFREALTRFAFDLILSDFSLPTFDGGAGLVLARTLRPEIPFIYVSGTIGEERAVESLKSGATDYVLKDHLDRLADVIRRALREARDRIEGIRAQHQLGLFRSLMDHSNDVIEVVDHETGRFLDVNRKACLTHGYSREEYLTLSFPDIVPALGGRPWSEIREELKRSGSCLIEAHHRRKDGSLFPIEINVTYVHLGRDYLLAVERDITERKKAEEALRLSEQRFRELAETIEDVFWMTNASKSRMLYVSPGYEHIWGRSRQSLYDDPTSWVNAIHPDDRDRIVHAAMTRQNLGAYDEEYRIVRPDGKVRWIRDRAFPVRDASGATERIVGVARDMTEWRELEAQLRQAQKMEGIGHVAGGVAHDFNNILAVIMMQAQLAETPLRATEQIRSDLQQIRAAAERGASLTRQLLLFSRRQVMQPRELNLNGIVTSLAKMLRRFIGEQVHLELRMHPAPLTVHADSGMLDQVILNLAVNARDAMPDGGRLIIETAEQTVDAALARLHPDAAPGRYACLTVSDTGNGIAPEIMPRIFEPFFTTKEEGKGTGLGLATVFGIVKQHRGWIQVDSRPGRGTTFRVLLPAITPTSVTVAPGTLRPSGRGGTETILLVEDETSVRLVTRALLERFGYRVLEAPSGAEAIKVWEESRHDVALLLTDLVMPGGLSGLQLAARLKRDKPALGVIYTSGYSAEITGSQTMLRSGENFLQKPFSPDQLLETVRRFLDAVAGQGSV